MSTEWIKFEKATSDKPEVHTMAAQLGIDPDAVVGKCLRVWGWFDTHSADGNAPVTVKALLDRFTGVTGFCDALIACGWMSETGAQISITDYGRHNGAPAKKRAQTRDRVNLKRERDANGNAPSVTRALPEQEQEEEGYSLSPRASAPEGGALPQAVIAKIEEIVRTYPKRQGEVEAQRTLAERHLAGEDLEAILTRTRAIATVIATRSEADRLRILAAHRFFADHRDLDDPETYRSAKTLEGPAKGKTTIEHYDRVDDWDEDAARLAPLAGSQAAEV